VKEVQLPRGDRLDVFEEVYGERDRAPEMQVTGKELEVGERVRVRDQRGNLVEAVVERRVFVVRPDFTTYRMRGQGSLL
jgi:putative ribosome biogenesis GTPase RsgA